MSLLKDPNPEPKPAGYAAQLELPGDTKISVDTLTLDPLHPEALLTVHGRRSGDGQPDSVVVSLTPFQLAWLWRASAEAHGFLRMQEAQAIRRRLQGGGL